ncbi:hypothetical protein VTJ49DRAFT_1346 [Mycothermus thermophilus]|uniref:Non-canonical purine NTP phosphatase/PRRC1 domain-containing protein n=1 Tax=Humicola insolens TaxID=85995 RepID=A0ABR3VPT7_HUMIN
MPQQSTPTPDVPKYDPNGQPILANPSLTLDKAKGQSVLPPLDKTLLHPLRPAINTTGIAYQDANPVNVLLVIPTTNKFKVRLLSEHLSKHKPDHVALSSLEVKADSQVGEQPYDSAGPQGAFNRVANAANKLFADAEEVKKLRDRRVGTVVVGAVENFIEREASYYTAKDGQKKSGPVDYGVLIFCRVSLSPSCPDKERVCWGSPGVSGGVTVPLDFMEWAMKFGFEDEGKRHGKVTVGEVIAANTGIDKADWHEPLAGTSRYDLLKEAMGRMEVPWPEI